MLTELLLAFAAFVAQPRDEPVKLGDIYQQALENPKLYGGDMILPPQGKPLGNAIVDESSLWPNKTIPYVIDDSLSEHKKLIEDAMEHFHNQTCVKFVVRTNQSEYVKVFKGKGCYSFVGKNKTNQPQPLSLGYGCYKIGTIIHQLGHVLGFYHEHIRSDRDKFINIYDKHIRPGMINKFEKLKPSENILVNDFDYDSIMIYSNYAFSSIPGFWKTMEAKNGHEMKNPNEKSEMTQSDIDRIRAIYNC